MPSLGIGYLGHASGSLLNILKLETPDPVANDDDASFTWTYHRLALDAGTEEILGLGRSMVADVTGVGDDVLVGERSGSVTIHPNGDFIPLRPLVASLKQHWGAPPEYSVFGIGDEMYSWNSSREIKRVLPPDSHLGRYEPGALGRVWANQKWVLRAFSTIAGDVWEVSRRNGSFARILAYGQFGACGSPLLGDLALTVDKANGAHRVVALSLLDSSIVWTANHIPLDRSDCIAGNGSLVAVGGSTQGHEAVAIFQNGQWQVVTLAGKRSIVEPLFYSDGILASTPDEDFLGGPPGTGGIRSAGAVYALAQAGTTWKVAKRLVATEPREMGLFGFRVIPSNQGLLINHYAGPRSPETPDGIADGHAEICFIKEQPDPG
jgi:hypothetical protein